MSNAEQRNYWGYRIDTQKAKFFNDELEKGHLRQGWGYEEEHKLPGTTDIGARGNLPIYYKVKKGDILLIPRLPSWNDITIAEATEDFDAGYKFEIDKEQKDYGHIFPAKIVKHFSRDSKNMHSGLQRTLKQPRRFWQISYGENVEEIIKSEDNQSVTNEERFRNSLKDAFGNSFDSGKFKDLIIENAKKNFANERWEYALVDALRIIYPDPYFEVKRVAGKKEKEHGTDILIKVFGLREDRTYGIAIQVKDWEGKAGEWAIGQLNKADGYWEKEEDIKLIDKMLIMTRMDYIGNEEFEKLCVANKIIPLFEEDLSKLLYEAGTAEFLKQ